MKQLRAYTQMVENRVVAMTGAGGFRTERVQPVAGYKVMDLGVWDGCVFLTCVRDEPAASEQYAFDGEDDGGTYTFLDGRPQTLALSFVWRMT